MEHMHQKLLIIDFGSQVTQLIARRLRELNVYCEIHPFQNVTEEFLTQFAPKAVIFSGGPASVIDEGSPRPPMAVFEMGIPVLGICYGQQVMMHCLGGKVERGHGTAEFGRAYVSPKASLGLLDGWFEGGDEQVWMSHGDHVSAIAPGFEVTEPRPMRHSLSQRTRPANSMLFNFIQKSITPPKGRSFMKISFAEPVLSAIGPWARIASRHYRLFAIKWEIKR
jgi:GMP synthase (glutamine-hydrolysing) A subunit